MVRVISAHHFTSQDVTCCSEPCSSTIAGDFLLLASPLHQIEVRDLNITSAPSHTFPTVDMVHTMVYSVVGRYLATVENRDNLTFVRIYINWWSPEAAQQPMRARIAGRVTPASSQEEMHLEMIELGVKETVTGLAVCPSTGNLLVMTGQSLVIHKYSLICNSQSKTKFIDFQECLNVTLNYKPECVKFVEDTVSCLNQLQVHIFKIKILDTSDEKQLRSLSTYSFSSESECSMESSPDKPVSYKSSLIHNPSFCNVTARRRTDSSSEREVVQGGIRKHPHHVTLGGGSSDDDTDSSNPGIEKIPVPLVEKTERELGSVSTPRILEQILGPCQSPPQIQVTVTLVPAAWAGSSLEGEVITLVYAKIIEEERPHEQLRLLQISPVYWREFRIKRERTGAGQTPPSMPHNPLQSIMYSHLMSITVMFSSVHEGYLYHIPGHIRKPGKGVGVQRIATYPFTSPILDLVLEPSLLHALTETGLETYTLRSGYHTVREAESVDSKSNACPPTSTPICLIGLRPFIGVKKLHLANTRLVLIAEPTEAIVSQSETKNWTVYSLHLPSHLDLYKDMLTVADMNVGAPHGFLQLLCEAHMVVRTWLHRLSWLQVMKPHGIEITQEDIDLVKQCFQESCLRLADHYMTCKGSKQYKLALPYFRMSKLSPLEVLQRNKITCPLPLGLIRYIEELILNPSSDENILDAAVADKIISVLGEYSLTDLVKLVIASPALRGFKTRQTLDFIEKDLKNFNNEFSVEASHAIAAVLVGGTGDWMSMVPPVQLSTTLLSYYHLLFDPGTKGSQESFSEFAITIRINVPVIFVEICVSLIESKLCSLGQILHLLLQTFMSIVTSPTAAADNAGILQLFLETYFVELITESSNIKALIPLDADQQQALLTLVRSYLAGLVHPLPGPVLDDSILLSGPADMFGARHEYLDYLPPFNTLENKQSEPTLLKLQSLLSSAFCDNNCRETVSRYVDEHQGVNGELSLHVLSQPVSKESVTLLCVTCPGALTSYCKTFGKTPNIWAASLESLLTQPPNPGNQQALEILLDQMSKTFPPEHLAELLPSGDEFQHYLTESKRIHQAAKMQELIVATGQKLLESLTL